MAVHRAADPAVWPDDRRERSRRRAVRRWRPARLPSWRACGHGCAVRGAIPRGPRSWPVAAGPAAHRIGHEIEVGAALCQRVVEDDPVGNAGWMIGHHQARPRDRQVVQPGDMHMARECVAKMRHCGLCGQARASRQGEASSDSSAADRGANAPTAPGQARARGQRSKDQCGLQSPP